MKKNILFLICASSISWIILSSSQDGVMSDGAPSSASGAPGEKNCTMSGCHDDTEVNIGPGVPSITINDNSTTYEPGKTYTLTVNISEENKEVFGFQTIAIEDETEKQAGEIILTDLARTQILPGFGQFAERSYTTYTLQGSYTSTPGSSTWSFDWKAPAEDVGPITIYTAFLAGNNDHTDGGDLVYTRQLKLQPVVSSIYEFQNTSLSLYPNPVLANTAVHLVQNENPIEEARIYSTDGKLIQHFSSIENNTITLKGMSPGIYLIQSKTGSSSSFTRLIVK